MPKKTDLGELGTLESWYDRRSRSWITQRKDKAGNQIGEALLAGQSKTMKSNHDSLLKVIASENPIAVVVETMLRTMARDVVRGFVSKLFDHLISDIHGDASKETKAKLRARRKLKEKKR